MHLRVPESAVDAVTRFLSGTERIPLFASTASPGFASPADDYIETTFTVKELVEYFMQRPAATFLVRISGWSMKNAGINDGSIVICDRGLDPVSGDVVLAAVDGQVADFEPRLRTLNDGKDSGITWRQLACQTSGYGLAEAPGAAFAYNDFAIAFYYDVLLHKVYHADANRVLDERIAGPLEFQDQHELTPPGKFYYEGILVISPLDLARFGLLMLHEGRWRERQVIRRDLVQLMLHSPVDPALPISSGKEFPMLPDQRSIGSDTRNDTTAGPGIYSFNWWLNKPNPRGLRLAPALPEDAFFALGSMGNMLCVVPSLDLVVAWTRSNADDCLEAFNRPDTVFSKATQFLAAAVVDRAK